MVGTVVDPFRRREIWYDSGLEEKWLNVLIASPDVVNVVEQQRVNFVRNGKKRHHFVDFVVTWRSGWVSGYPVKYRKDIKPKLLDDLAAMADQRDDDFADDFSILTEKDVDLATIENARQIVSCGLDFDDEAKAFVLAELSHLDDRVCLQNLDRLAGDGVRASRAAIALIQQGVLAAQPGEVIKPGTLLCNRFTS